MLWSAWRRRFDPADSERVERLLSVGRLVLALASLIAVYADPTEPSRYSRLAYTLLAAYVLLAAAVWIALRIRPSGARALAPWLHVTDIVWAAVLTIFTSGPSSPFFILFTFVILGAAYRWGLSATVATAAMAIGLLLVQGTVIAGRVSPEIPFELNRLLIRCSYLLFVAVFVGVLAEREQRLHAQSLLLARALAAVQSKRDFASVVNSIAREVLAAFDMASALVVLRELETGRVFLWRIGSAHASHADRGGVAELSPDERAVYVFDPPEAVDVWYVARSVRRPNRLRLLAVDGAGARVDGFRIAIPEAFSSRHSWGTLLCARLRAGDEWIGQLILIEQSLRRLRVHDLVFLQALCRQVVPAIYSVYLIRRLRSRIGAVERARVARELHDGVIQSLFSLQLQLEAVRQRTLSTTDTWLPETMDRLQEHLRGEILNLRDLMRQLQTPDASSGRIVELIAERVDRFVRDTGISARFICDHKDLQLPPRLCQELVRIVQEALVNVRKHSGASNVVVWFDARDGFWRVVVDDDGKGFGFEGKLTQAQLDVGRRGPIVIRERVRTIGGTMSIESQPGRGSRVEVLIPQGSSGT